MNVSVVRAWLKNRLPGFQEVLAVYGVIVVIVYGWTIYWYLWKLPSWLYFMSLSEILVVYAYDLLVNFLESLIVLALPLFLSLALPATWLRDKFAARSTVIVIVLLVALMKYVSTITLLFAIPPGLFLPMALGAAGTIALAFAVGRIAFLRKIVEEIANRAVIFVYIFAPLTAISFVVVLVRNIAALIAR